MSNWDYTTDFLVIGSGAGALTAAIRAKDLGANVLVIEKSTQFGGTSAMSGGALWVPNNHLMPEKGISDSDDAAFNYLSQVISEGFKEDRIRQYIATAKRAVKYLTDHTHLQFNCCPAYPDYYPHINGGKPGGRTIEPTPFNSLNLGEHRDKLRAAHPQMYMMGLIMLTGQEAQIAGAGGYKAGLIVARLIVGHFLNLPARLKSMRSTRVTLGNSLVGCLSLSAIERGIPLWASTPAKKLVMAAGRVIGVEIEKEHKTLRIRTNKGVLIASGGFERNLEMRKKYQQPPWSDEWPATHLHNTGDGIQLGIDVGADLGLMEHSWWMPTIKTVSNAISYIMVFEKSVAGTIIVTQEGKRFVNESAPYDDVGRAMRKEVQEGRGAAPAFFIFDKNYRQRFPIGNIQPATIQPDSRLSERQKRDFITIAGSVEALANKLDIPVENLEQTIEKFNGFARSGVDEDFKRGDSIYDRYYCNPRVKPNPNLGQINSPPYYAVKLYPGDLGTKGGLVTDCHARVLNPSGEIIPGLYATGNCSESVMGNAYPGAGATLGPAVTFGFLAAEDAAS